MARHLIVNSQHRNEGFLTKVTADLLGQLNQFGEEVCIRNLYEMNFSPILTKSDFEALQSGILPREITREQEFITHTEYIWFIFPIWWTSMPAILKGYIDRVFLNGFAYRLENDKPVGLLKDKKVIILNSMGMSREDYEQRGIYKAMEITIDKGIFEFVGMKVIAHRYFTSIMSAKPETRNAYLNEIIELVEQIIEDRLLGSNFKNDGVMIKA